MGAAFSGGLRTNTLLSKDSVVVVQMLRQQKCISLAVNFEPRTTETYFFFLVSGGGWGGWERHFGIMENSNGNYYLSVLGLGFPKLRTFEIPIYPRGRQRKPQNPPNSNENLYVYI